MLATAIVSTVSDERKNEEISFCLSFVCLLSLLLLQKPAPTKPEAKAKKPAKVKNLSQLHRWLMGPGCNSTAHIPFQTAERKGCERQEGGQEDKEGEGERRD